MLTDDKLSDAMMRSLAVLSVIGMSIWIGIAIVRALGLI